MSFLMLRATDFATATKPFVRERFSWHPPNAPEDYTTQLRGALLNAFELTFNSTRGTWHRRVQIPLGRARSTSLYVTTQVFFDFVTFTQQSWDLSPSKYPTRCHGGTIFNPDLPPLLRYGKVIAMTVISPFTSYTSLQVTYYLMGFIAMTLFGHVAEQWPPIFRAPWLATILSDYRGVRWHQLFKRLLIVCGVRPEERFFERDGGILGAFFISGIVHDFGM